MHAFISTYVLPFSLSLLGLWLDRAAAMGLLDPLAGRAARQIMQSMRTHPEHWHQLDAYTVDFSITPLKYSHEAPLRLWVGNGRIFVHTYGSFKQRFHPIGKLCLWHAYRQWRRQQVPALEEVLAGRRLP